MKKFFDRLLQGKKFIPTLCITMLLLCCMISSCITVSRYTSSSSTSGNGGIVYDAPELMTGGNGAWGFNGTFSPSDTSYGISYTVDNTGGEFDLNIIVTLTVDGILPFDYELKANGTGIEPYSASREIYVYHVDIGDEAIDFNVSATWQPDKYDERLNGLTESFTLTVYCEQLEGGDAQ